MPKITIKESDNAASVSGSYANFSVVVPGFVGTPLNAAGFDENGICEVSTKDDFIKYIGKVAQKEKSNSVGNQIAYELVCLGYTVLFKKITSADTALQDYDNFWSCLEDKANYDFRYVCTGLLKEETSEKEEPKKDENSEEETTEEISEEEETKTSTNANIAKLAKNRGDCIALLDISNNVYDSANTQSTNISAIVSDVNNNFTDTSKYVAIFAPTVTYNRVADKIYNNNTLPGSFHYLVCAAEAFATYPEWFAVAGYTRGISSEADYKILNTGVKFGEAAINALEPRNKSNNGIEKAVNLIVKIKNSYYLWGNRTAHDLEEVDATAGTGDLKASHFLNIRQLCCTLKKQLYINCRRFTFEPNSDVLWINFVNAIEPLLEKMKANQGIEDYQIIKVKSTQKAKFSAIIRIVPIEAVEDFDLTITLEDSITGATVSVEESVEE